MYEGFYSSSMMPLNVKLTVILLPLAIAPRAVQQLLHCQIPLRPSDTSPKTGEELAVGLPTEGREILRATVAQNAARLAYDLE